MTFKLIKINCFLIIVLLVLPFVNAQAEDPGVTPDNFLWGLDKALDNIALLLTFDKGEKARKGLEIARERLLEVRAMIEENKLEAAEKAKNEHGKTLVKVKDNVKGIEKAKALEEIENIIEIEKELVEHDENVEKTFEELKIKIEVKGQITQQQRDLINSILEGLKGQTGEVEIEIENKKDKTKIKIKQETGKSDEEIEDEIEGIEKKQGLLEKRKERADEQIKDSKEDLNDLGEELQEHKLEGHVEDDTAITKLMGEARAKLTKAEEAFNNNDFGEAFGQANAAEQLIKNAEKILENIVEKFEEEAEEREIEVEIKEGFAKVEVEIGDEKLRFRLDTTDLSTIVNEISTRTGLSVEEINSIIEVEEEEIEEEETEEEDEDENMGKGKNNDEEDNDEDNDEE